MAPGGMSNFCDDCGYQACLQANCCLEHQAQFAGCDVRDLELDVAAFAVVVRRWVTLPPPIPEGVTIRLLPADELAALERELDQRPARPFPSPISGGADE
ncbi:hypothetical protein D3C73_1501610 [compost metagenome]